MHDNSRTSRDLRPAPPPPPPQTIIPPSRGRTPLSSLTKVTSCKANARREPTGHSTGTIRVAIIIASTMTAATDSCDALQHTSTFNFVLSIGILAGVIGSFVPQHIKIVRRRSSEGISPKFLLFGTTSGIFAVTNVVILSADIFVCCRVIVCLFLFIFLLFWGSRPMPPWQLLCSWKSLAGRLAAKRLPRNFDRNHILTNSLASDALHLS